MSETKRGSGTPEEPQSGTPVHGEGRWEEPAPDGDWGGPDGDWGGPDEDADDRAPQVDGGDRRKWK